MHVCHFCDTTFESEFFRTIVVGLKRRGVRVSLVELGRGSPPGWLPADVAYLSLGAATKLHYPMAVWRLARFLRDENVDILHTHLFFSGIIGVLTKHLHRKTIVALMRHHTGVVRMLGSRFHIAADKWMAERADRILTVSLAARNYMRETDGIDRDDIEFVHLGFDFERLSPTREDRTRVRREFGIGDGDFVIGYVANFINGKGHLQLIEAFGKIAAETPDARLFLAGRGMLAEVHAAAAKFEKGKIIFAGWRDDIPAYLSAMDLFVHPSLSEAFSQVLIEAMGVGLPVIATDVGGAREVIENRMNGILVEPDDPDAIYRETVRLYSDAGLRRQMANAGQSSVRERFTAEQMVDRYFELYKSWMNRPDVEKK